MNMDYLKSSRGNDKKSAIFHTNWKKKMEANQYLKRVKASHKSNRESTGVPKINTSSRPKVSTKQVKEEYKPELPKVSDTVRTQSNLSTNETLEFKVNLTNCSVSSFRNASIDNSNILHVPMETKHGLSYDSVLRTFRSMTDRSHNRDNSSDALLASTKHFHHASGINLQDFLARAKPLLDYKKLSIK